MERNHTGEGGDKNSEKGKWTEMLGVDAIRGWKGWTESMTSYRRGSDRKEGDLHEAVVEYRWLHYTHCLHTAWSDGSEWVQCQWRLSLTSSIRHHHM